MTMISPTMGRRIANVRSNVFNVLCLSEGDGNSEGSGGSEVRLDDGVETSEPTSTFEKESCCGNAGTPEPSSAVDTTVTSTGGVVNGENLLLNVVPDPWGVGVNKDSLVNSSGRVDDISPLPPINLEKVKEDGVSALPSGLLEEEEEEEVKKVISYDEVDQGLTELLSAPSVVKSKEKVVSPVKLVKKSGEEGWVVVKSDV